MTFQRLRLFFAASLCATLLIPMSASADIINPYEEICETKNAGDACNLEGGGSGVCTAATCSRLDYSEGTPPKTVDYDCLRCEPGEPGNGGETNGAETNGAETNGDHTNGDPSETNTGDGAPAPTNSGKTESGGCSVSNASSLTTVSFLVGAFLFGGLLLRRRR